jgi:hypothetical protein
VVTVIRNALGPEVNYTFITDANGVKRTKLVIISFLCPKGLSQAGFRGEFTKQVQGQQEGLNKLIVLEWFTNRSSFLRVGRSNKEQQAYRKTEKPLWIQQKALEIQTRPYSQALLIQLRKVLSDSDLLKLHVFQYLKQNQLQRRYGVNKPLYMIPIRTQAVMQMALLEWVMKTSTRALEHSGKTVSI